MGQQLKAGVDAKRVSVEDCGGKGTAQVAYSYASLNEHLLRLSLRHALRRRDYRCASSIIATWTLSWTVFVALMLPFSLYGCEFYSKSVGGNSRQALLFSWAWSIGQRFLLNEPVTILIAAVFVNAPPYPGVALWIGCATVVGGNFLYR